VVVVVAAGGGIIGESAGPVVVVVVRSVVVVTGSDPHADTRLAPAKTPAVSRTRAAFEICMLVLRSMIYCGPVELDSVVVVVVVVGGGGGGGAVTVVVVVCASWATPWLSRYVVDFESVWLP
jgi:hypothetical protein